MEYQNTIPFDLNKANKGYQVLMRNGTYCSIIATDLLGDFPILIKWRDESNKNDLLGRATLKGQSEKNAKHDLFLIQKVTEKWAEIISKVELPLNYFDNDYNTIKLPNGEIVSFDYLLGYYDSLKFNKIEITKTFQEVIDYIMENKNNLY